MSKTFRPWDVDQAWLLPPSVHDFVPAGQPAHLLREIVREVLDLGAILATYEEPRYPPFHPGMMTALPALRLHPGHLSVAADRQGVRGTGRRHGGDRPRVRPDFRTINQFRKRHLEALAGLFVQVLGLCPTGRPGAAGPGRVGAISDEVEPFEPLMAWRSSEKML